MNIDTNGIEIEDVVRDKITGFEGKVIGITQWTTGCARAAVQPPLNAKNQEEGTMPKMWDIDCLNLEVIAPGARHAAQPEPAAVGAHLGPPPTERESLHAFETYSGHAEMRLDGSEDDEVEDD